jgi:HEPN domain-containing protein
MRPPEEVRREHVRRWLAKADSDYRVAERLASDAEPLREAVAFHCQQAAEKHLKALLVRHGIEFPKTHSIGELLDLLAPVSGDTASSLGEAAVLTPYGVEIRYPSDFPDVLPGEEAELLKLTRQVRKAVLDLLDPYLREPGP